MVTIAQYNKSNGDPYLRIRYDYKEQKHVYEIFVKFRNNEHGWVEFEKNIFYSEFRRWQNARKLINEQLHESWQMALFEPVLTD